MAGMLIRYLKIPLKHATTLVIASVALSACSVGTPKVGIKSGETPRTVLNLAAPSAIDNGPTSGPESFSVAAYGVAASPVVARGPKLPRGGGYEKVGRSYVVAGKRYHPTRNPKAVQYGRASWYGKAFHGRKTANGEVYDMNHLTAAHKTMPLPSYARVTNVKNGNSVIVRVNDRGPFSNNRVIDLSKRAAQVLDYTKAGTAEVKVEYIGPAPLHGQDDDYLIASAQGIPGTIAKPLPGVRQNIIASENNPVPVPEAVVSSYTQWRVSTAFDAYKTEKNGLLWKRINAR